MNNYILWLTLRLMKKQKLRTLAVFCGILLSSFLLHTFCNLGFYFWEQVHDGTSEAASFDSTQQILTALAAVLFAIVFGCSAIWVHNLFSLTFAQKWQGVLRLMTLGASLNHILFMTTLELCILSSAAIPCGWVITYCTVQLIGIHTDIPFWCSRCVDIWLFGLSYCFGLLPVLCAARRPQRLSRMGYMSALYRRRHPKPARHAAKYPRSFAAWMSGKYRLANRRHHSKMTLAILSALILYIPASYLIGTNLRINQEGLHQTYGIEYICTPSKHQELLASIKECHNLIKAAAPAASVFYVKVPGKTDIAPHLLSSELLAVLKKAGWTEYENKKLHADSDIYFLEDSCYDTYVRSCLVSKTFLPDDGQPDNSQPDAILVNCYINRTSYQKHADAGNLFSETPLLNTDAKTIFQKAASDMKIYCSISETLQDTRQWIQPTACCEKLPEGIRAGNVTVILPLRRLFAICTDMDDFMGNFFGIESCGRFADEDDILFDTLKQRLGSNATGRLINTRKNYQLWYDSLHDIHLAMLYICGLLFFTAFIHVFCTMLFHGMQRRHGFAILWSLGQTKKELTVVLALESIRSFIHAMLLGIPIACLLCYCIYKIYRPVWQIKFLLPLGQLLLIAAMTALASAAALIASHHLLGRQDFLTEIRDMTGTLDIYDRMEL